MKKKSLNGIRAAGAELGDEHAGEGGAGAPRGVEDNGVETDGIGQIIGRHSIGDQGVAPAAERFGQPPLRPQ